MRDADLGWTASRATMTVYSIAWRHNRLNEKQEGGEYWPPDGASVGKFPSVRPSCQIRLTILSARPLSPRTTLSLPAAAIFSTASSSRKRKSVGFSA